MNRHDYPGVRILGRGDPVLGRLPERLAAAYAERVAFVMPRGQALSRWTFRELTMQIGQMALQLHDAGIQPGDRVALMGENSPEWIMAFFAILTAGAIAMPLDPQLTRQELAGLIDHAEPTGAFASPRLMPLFGAVGTLIPLEPAPFQEVASTVTSPASPEDTAALLYTSGTTGHPKGVTLTHRNLWANALGCAEVLSARPDDVSLCVLPLHHAYSLTNTVVALASGIQVAFSPSLKPDSILETIRAAQVTVVPAVPLVIDHLVRGIEEQINALPQPKQWVARRLLALGSRVRAKLGSRAARRVCAPILRPFGRLRGMIVGGAALNPASAKYFHGLGLTVLHGYGLTETSPVVALTPAPWRPGHGVGKPLRGVGVRIADPNEHGIGEISVRGPNVMKGYFQDAEATAEVLQEGWLKTGDLGRLDAQGYLHLHGRSKDVIVLANGKNVYPDELELHYGNSEVIAEICVLAAHQSDGTEYPLGVIVPDLAATERRLGPGHSAAALRELVHQEIKRLSVGLADYKRLKRFELQDTPLPRNHAHKVLRHEIFPALRT